MAFSPSLSGSTAAPTLRSIREELMRGSAEWELLTASQMQAQLSAQLRAAEDDIFSVGSNDVGSSMLFNSVVGKANPTSSRRTQFGGEQPAAGASLERLLTEAQHESIANSRIASGGASKLGSPSMIATPVDFTYISCMRLSSPGTRSRAGEAHSSALVPATRTAPVARAVRPRSGHHHHRRHQRGGGSRAPNAATNRYTVPTSASVHPQLLRSTNDKKYSFTKGLTVAQISKRSRSDPNLPDNATSCYDDENIDAENDDDEFYADEDVPDENASQMFAKFAAESYRNPILSLTNNGTGVEDLDQADWLWDWTAWRNHFEMSYALERIEEMEASSAKHRKRIYGVVLLSNIAALLLGFFIGRTVAKSYASGSLVRS